MSNKGTPAHSSPCHAPVQGLMKGPPTLWSVNAKRVGLTGNSGHTGRLPTSVSHNKTREERRLMADGHGAASPHTLL